MLQRVRIVNRRVRLGIQQAAKLLDMNHGHLRREIMRGKIEAFRVGKRGIRIFLDSLLAYQQQRQIVPKNDAAEPALSRRQRASSAHLAAMARLHKLGIVD